MREHTGTPNDLLELATRCEMATGPDRELDAEIYHAVTGDEPVMIFADSYGPNEPVQQVGFAQGKYVSRFTASIDTVMTLVPEGLSLRKEWLPAGSWPARCYIHKDQSMPLDDADFSFRGIGKSEALAVCAAALRARQALRDHAGTTLSGKIAG